MMSEANLRKPEKCGGDVMDILKRRGRPKSVRPKSHVYRIRLDEKEVAKLEYVREKFGETTSEVFREGLRIRYNLAMFKD